MSTEKNEVVARRCEKIKVECFQGYDKKIEKLKQIVHSFGLNAENVAFIGNDLNDIECMEWVGLSVAVNDAHPKVKDIATVIAKTVGGSGVAMEIAEMIISGKNL